MRKLLIRAITPLLAIAASLSIGYQASAQTPFAGEDFDGGQVFADAGLTNIAGPTSSSFTPDNSALLGNFPSDGRDIFGIVNRNTQQLIPNDREGGGFIPFDLVDESLEGTFDENGMPTAPFISDVEGILRSTDTDNVVAVADSRNNDNLDGNVSASWTFNISGRSNLQLSIDIAAQGDFEAADDYSFTYSIDGGAPQTAFAPVANEDASFTLLRENPELPILENTSFQAAFHDILVLGGMPFGNDTDMDSNTGPEGEEDFIDYDPLDDGFTNGDLEAQDGFISLDLDGDGVFTQTRSYRITDRENEANPRVSDTPEFEVLEPRTLNDPLELDGEIIPNVLTTYTTSLNGTGTTLTLNFSGGSNADDEYFVFDEILLFGELGGGDDLGDFNGDGVVNAADFVVYRDGASPNGLATLDDFNEFAANFDATPQSVANARAVPEPATGLLFLLSLAGVLARRR